MPKSREQWFKLFNWYYLVWSALIVIVFIVRLAGVGPPSEESWSDWGVDLIAGTLAVVNLGYNLIGLRLVRKRSQYIAYLASFLLFVGINAASLEAATGRGVSWVFIFNNYFINCVAAFFGPSIAVAGLGVAGILYIMILTGTVPPTASGFIPEGIALVARIVIVAFIIYKLREQAPIINKEQSDRELFKRYFSAKGVAHVITDSLATGIIIVDSNGLVQLINPEAGRLIGIDSKDAVELSYKSILPLYQLNQAQIPDNQHPVAEVLANQKPVIKEYLLRNQKGEFVYIDVVISSLTDPAHNKPFGVAVIIRDVSTKKREEQARAEFISTASHEMRTPVAAIEGYLALAMNDKVSKIDTKARDYLEKAHTSTQHLGKLFQDLLTSAKAEDGRLSNHPVVVELGAYLEQLTQDLRFAAEKKNLRMEYVVGSSNDGVIDARHPNAKRIQPLYYAYVDPDRLREVVTNLFDNAVKYTDTGKISIGLTGNNDIIQFYVRDTGPGIPPEDVPHLFQKFYRVNSTLTRTIGGTGLGLFISRKIIELYHGRIWVESEVNKGSTFLINLPRLTTAKAVQIQAAEKTPALPGIPTLAMKL